MKGYLLHCGKSDWHGAGEECAAEVLFTYFLPVVYHRLSLRLLLAYLFLTSSLPIPYQFFTYSLPVLYLFLTSAIPNPYLFLTKRVNKRYEMSKRSVGEVWRRHHYGCSASKLASSAVSSSSVNEWSCNLPSK